MIINNDIHINFIVKSHNVCHWNDSIYEILIFIIKANSRKPQI